MDTSDEALAMAKEFGLIPERPSEAVKAEFRAKLDQLEQELEARKAGGRRPPVTTDDLAGLLAEHGDWGYGHGAFIRCNCGAHVGFPDDDGQHKGKRALAAHQAAVIAAAGWKWVDDKDA